MAHLGRRHEHRVADASRTALPSAVDAVKALAHPGRMRILAMLRGGDLCVCQLAAVLGAAASTVSSHLSDLRRAGLVTERRDGKWVHYHLVRAGSLARLVRDTLTLVDADDRIHEDARTVAGLRAIPLEAFCNTGLRTKGQGRAPRPRTAQ